MARETQKSTRNTIKSKSGEAAKSARASNNEKSGAEQLKAQHQELQSILEKRSNTNANRSAIVKEFAILWLPHQAVEEEILVPALRNAGFEEATIVAGEIRKDLINILLADLLEDEDEESLEPRLEALAREFDGLVESHQDVDEAARTAIGPAEAQTPSLSSQLKERYEWLKQRFADVDENFDEAMDMLAPRRLSGRSRRRRRDSRMEMRDRDQRGRFLPEDDRERSQGRWESRRDGDHQSRSRYEEQDRFYRRGRQYDEDERYGGRGEGRGSGWYGDPQGHSEASHRGWEGRGREYDEDERYRGRGGEGRGHGGWYGDPEGHSRASRRGWEDSREGSYGSRSRFENEDERNGGKGYEPRRGRSEDDGRRASRGGRYGSERT